MYRWKRAANAAEARESLRLVDAIGLALSDGKAAAKGREELLAEVIGRAPAAFAFQWAKAKQAAEEA